MAARKVPLNPTRGSSTIWQYTLMMLMAINYLLEKDAKHEYYSKMKKAQKAAEKAAGNAVPDLTPLQPDPIPPAYAENAPPLNYTRSSPAYHPPCPSPPSEPNTRWPYPRPSNSVHVDEQEKYLAMRARKEREAVAPLSRSQRKDVWMKMRAVKRVPIDVYELEERPSKKVAWGHVDVVEYELGDEDEGSVRSV